MNYLETKIQEKEEILLVIPKESSLELMASVFALAISLETLQKNIRVISDNSYKDYPFLSFPKKISEDIEDVGDLFISIDTRGRKVEEIRYEKLEDEIRIHLGSADKAIKKKHISAKLSKIPFELVVVFGVNKKEDLGDLHKENKEIFDEAETIIVNKDNYATFVYDLLSELKIDILRPVATNLLAAIMAETNGFNNLKEHRSFKLASQLIKMNANYQQIATFFYKDKSQVEISALKLILKNAYYLKNNIFFSKIPNFELKRSGLSSNEIISAIIKLKGLTSEKNSIIVAMEPPREKIEKLGIVCVFASFNKDTLSRFSEIFESQAKNNGILFSVKANSLQEAENKISKLIK